jgi:hypothetical protein
MKGGLNIAPVSCITWSILKLQKWHTSFWNPWSNGTRVTQIVGSCKSLGVQIALHPQEVEWRKVFCWEIDEGSTEESLSRTPTTEHRIKHNSCFMDNYVIYKLKNSTPHFKILEVKVLILHKCWFVQVSRCMNSIAPSRSDVKKNLLLRNWWRINRRILI